MTGAGNQVAGLLLADAPRAGAAPSSPSTPSPGEPGRRRGQVRPIGPAPMGHWPLPAAARAGHSRMRRRGTCSTSMQVTKRFGPVTALDRCTFSARPGRLTGFLGPNGAGKTTAMRAVFGLVELDEGSGPVARCAGPRRGPGPVRLHAGGAGPVPADAGAGPARSTSASCAGASRRPWPQRGYLAGASRPGRAGGGPAGRAVARQPAAGPADRRAGNEPGPAGARRAVLRPGPDRHRGHGRAAVRPGRGGRDGAVLQPPAGPGPGPVPGRGDHRARPDRAGRRTGGAAGQGAAAVHRHPVPGPGA